MVDCGVWDVRYLVTLRRLLTRDLTGYGGDGEACLVNMSSMMQNDDQLLMSLESCRTNSTFVSGI